MTSWLSKTSVIYQIFIDRFAGYDPKSDDTKPEWCGGNLRGIKDKLPYLVDLGVDTVWLTPFFKTADYHGYSTVDFFEVDPHFGTLQDLQELANLIHKLGMRLIIDFTANHTSDQHPYFLEALHNPKSQYRSWYYFDDKNDYRTFLNFKSLPKLNLSFPAARDHVTESAVYWITQLKADGLRLDHAVGPNKKFWRYFVKQCKQANPDIATIGEVGFFGVHYSLIKTFEMEGMRWLYWWNKLTRQQMSSTALKPFVKLFDGCLDFTFLKILQQFGQGKLTGQQVRTTLDRHYRQFPKSFILPAFLSNQDKNRFMFMAGQNYETYKKGVEILFEVDQPKIIYYGDEVGMTHGSEVVPNSGWAGDLPARRKMNWEPNEQGLELREFYKELIAKSKS